MPNSLDYLTDLPLHTFGRVTFPLLTRVTRYRISHVSTFLKYNMLAR